MESSSDEEPVDGHPNSTHDIKPRQARSCSSVVSTAKHAIPSSQTPRCPICSYRFFDSQPEAQRCSHVEACLRAQSEQEARQEATNSAGTTCAVCSVSLAHLSAEQQNAHVNVCLDAAAAAEAVVATTTTANSPKLGGAQRSIRATTSATAAADEARGVDFLLVAECPCCRTTFKAQQTSRARLALIPTEEHQQIWVAHIACLYYSS